MGIDEVISILKDKGWALYCADNHETLDNIVPKGPVNEIVMNKQYVILPLNDNQTNVDKMRGSVKDITARHVFPIGRYFNKKLPLNLFYVSNNVITVRGFRDLLLTPEEFISAVKTIPNLF